MASMLLFREEWTAAGYRLVSTATGLNALAGTTLCFLVLVVWLSLHYFDLAYQRFEQTVPPAGGRAT
jgi:hypothetical protein